MLTRMAHSTHRIRKRVTDCWSPVYPLISWELDSVLLDRASRCHPSLVPNQKVEENLDRQQP